MMKEFTQSPELSERLAAHGWRPEQLAQAVRDNMFLIDLHQQSMTGPEREAKFVVLADVVGRIHQHRLRLALELRQNAMKALSKPTVDADGRTTASKGWTFDRIGELVGLSKQRVRAIVRGHGAR